MKVISVSVLLILWRHGFRVVITSSARCSPWGEHQPCGCDHFGHPALMHRLTGLNYRLEEGLAGFLAFLLVLVRCSIGHRLYCANCRLLKTNLIRPSLHWIFAAVGWSDRWFIVISSLLSETELPEKCRRWYLALSKDFLKHCCHHPSWLQFF